MLHAGWLRTAALYVLAACVLTWPLATQLTTHLGASEGPGDPYLNLWVLGWDLHAWTTSPLGVLSGRVFDANIFFPVQASLTFSDHLLLQSLILSPIFALSHDVVLCYNLLLLGSLAASGLAMHVLVRSVTGSTSAAVVAGLAWACWPFRTAHVLHLQLQALYFLPLALWALHRFAAARRRQDAAWLGLFSALQAWSSVYYGVMTAMVVGVCALSLAWTTGQWRNRQFWTRLVIAVVLGGLLVAPIALPYWRSQLREGFGRNLSEAAGNAATFQSYSQVSPDNLLYGRTGLLSPRAPLPGERDRRHVEHQMFPGLVLLALAAMGIWRARRTDARPVAMTAFVVVVCGVILSLGPDGIRVLYATIADSLFGFQAIRAPARFAVVAVAGLCVLAGVGVAQSTWRPAVVGVIAVLMMLEFVNAPLTFVAAPARSTPTGRWLKSAPGPGAVLYLPLTLDRDNSRFMVQSLEHLRPIVNGYSGQRPSFFTSFVDTFADPLSLDARALLREAGVRFVVSPRALEMAGEGWPFVERARFDDGVIYEVVWTEASEAALDDVAGEEPPPPGPIPFAPGETSTYEVKWLTGPLDLPAGTITLRARRPGPGDPVDRARGAEPTWVFDALVDSAPWVSRFFEAHDTFRTTADDRLKPLVHERALREGSRVLDRAFVFDPLAHRVRIGEHVAAAATPGALVLPLAPGARDALTVFWYVRTLPIAAGLSLSMPINEAGRSMSLQMTVTGREMVTTDRGPVAAFRVEPRITARVERRRPISLVVWLSDDGRRVPLAAEIDASFGRLRLKLVDYQP